MRPEKSFIIWFSPRTGSTLLCKSLEDTGVCGSAGEFLNDPGDRTLISFYGVADFPALCQLLWQKGSSANGVFGMKYSCYRQHHMRISKELQQLQNQESVDPFDWQVLNSLFPNCKHIYLTRRNKVRVAASWWKAIQDQQWHRQEGHTAPQNGDFYAQRYDLQALQHLFKEHCLREASMEAYFSFNDIQPLTIVYEDFIRNYENTLQEILYYLEIDSSDVVFKPPFYIKTSDDHTEAWVQRFKSDMQAGWDKKIW